MTAFGGAGGAAASVAGSSGGNVLVIGGQPGVAGTEGDPEHTLCGNQFFETQLSNPPPEGFFGTFDAQPAELFPESETSGTPFVQVLHRQGRLQSMTFGFAVKDSPYNGYLQIRTDQCQLVGNLFRPGDEGLVDFTPQATSFSCTTVTDNWTHGVATGAVHAEFERQESGERHVLDGTFSFPVGFTDSSVGL